MARVDELVAKARRMIEKLDFDGCVELFEKLPSGHPMIDLVFERMETLDAERFENWL